MPVCTETAGELPDNKFVRYKSLQRCIPFYLISHRDTPVGQVFLHIFNRILAVVKYAGCQNGVGLSFSQRVIKVFKPTGSATGDHRHLDHLTYSKV